MTLTVNRRHFLASSAAPLLFGCGQSHDITGGFTGLSQERGHLLRDATRWPAPSVIRKTRVLIAGGGVAGLAAARALRLKGMNDFAQLELEDNAGGNSRGTTLQGIACPLGAHYLPVPGDDAPEVQNLLEEFGLRQRVAGRWVADERHLCHSPQERLFFNGAWQDGLLPVHGVGADTLAQYRQFAQRVEQVRQEAVWRIPASKRPLAPVQHALAAITFIAYLDQHGLTDPHLRWYLDYCCRDDYGAGIATVSAWAGLHYFASRHGFHVPGEPGLDGTERDGVFTWPEGNAWLIRRLAQPLQERLVTGRVVLRIAEGKHGVELDAFDTATQVVERWSAEHAIVALPIFVAARVVDSAPDFLQAAAQRTVYAPWLVANIHLRAPLQDRSGPAPSWDNVIYGDARTAPGLGYVDAMHQSLQPVRGETVLTYYRTLGDEPGGPVAGRRRLLERPWAAWRDDILTELSLPHTDLRSLTTHMDITRYGHAMAVPVPKNLNDKDLQPPWNKRSPLSKNEQLTLKHGRMHFAHSDWAGYSVFEEAFTLGHAAGHHLHLS